jgi:hypothetical protein
MFDLKRPCASCPFRKGQGECFKLDADRLEGIFGATSFQCHKTVDYDNEDDPIKRQGTKPQQCAGLMSLLHRAGKPNQIMQVGERLGYFDGSKLVHADAYESIDATMEAHS